MISDESAEKAADWLRENAKSAGELRGERIKQEAMLKHVKAVLMAQSLAKSAADREAEAYAHPRYLAQLESMSASVTADEENRALREAAALRIEVWRTQCSNVRGRI